MPLTEEQLRERWKTPEGRQRLAGVSRALRLGEKDWEKYLVGFSGVGEVKNQRDLRCISPESSILRNAPLNDADLSGAWLSWGDLGGKVVCADLSDASLSCADLSNTGLGYAKLSGVSLWRANLSGAYLENADLSGVTFGEAKLNRKTDLRAIRFSPEHPVSYDGSDTIKTRFLDRWVNWSKIRKIGQFPLFGVSWAAFALSLTVVNFLGAINTGLVKFGWVTEPIPMPLRMELILLDSILLVLGTTLYKLFCPDTIQEFSETQWVSQHHQPRLIYFREMWRKWWLVWPTGIFSISGALLALYLIGERVWMAAKYLLRFG